MNPDVTLTAGKPNSLLGGSGAAVVVHSGADDYKSQPSGDAGDRIACGVIAAK
jgi:Cu-Zn family superoxide dismutase